MPYCSTMCAAGEAENATRRTNDGNLLDGIRANVEGVGVCQLVGKDGREEARGLFDPFEMHDEQCCRGLDWNRKGKE